MATIKTNTTNGVKRIITKTQGGVKRISCSCCEEAECCMYPAQALADGIYSASDLPDSVFIDTGEVRQAFRSGTNFIIANGFAAGEDVVLGLNGNVWSQWVEAGSGPEFIIGDYNGACLINFYDVELVGSPIITDNFADTYTIEVIRGTPMGPVTYTSSIVRQSLCLWTTVDPEVEVLVAGIEYDGITCKWIQHDPDDINGTKQDDHNTPEGTYISGSGSAGDSVVDATIIIS